MTETPQTHTFRAMTDVDDYDAFPNAPEAVEYTMKREEAVMLLQDAAMLIATGRPLRKHDIPTQTDPHWLQSGDGDVIENETDLARAVTWYSDLASIRHEYFRLVHVAGSVCINLVGKEKNTNAELSVTEIVSPEGLKEMFQITDAEAQPQMHLVQGTDFSVPGKITVICPTMELARNHALDLTNTIRQGVGLAPVADADKYEEALQEAREARADELGCDVDDPDMVQADVWIEEIPVMTAMPQDIMALRADPAANRQRSRPR